MGHSYSSLQPRNTPPRIAQPTNTCRFPPELLLLILEAAYCDLCMPSAERRAGLCAASLVSIAWLYPSQQLLWRSIDVRGTFQLRSLRRTCEARDRGSQLATHTRKLSVWKHADDPPVRCPTMHEIARLLKRLPRLEELCLDRPPSYLPIFASLDLQIAMTRRPDVSKLTTLRIAFARPALVHALMRIIPSLRFVDVSGSRSSTEEDAGIADIPPGPSPGCKLYELRWGVNSRLHATHALHASRDTLRILALHSLPPNFPALMRTHGALLRSLRIFRYDASLPYAIRYCPVLEEFIMQDHVPCPEILAALPLTLEHLAIDCDYEHQCGLGAVAGWVEQRRGRLRVLTCFSPDVADAAWPSFVRACQSSCVELRCFKGWHGQYGDVHEELGEVDRFPRAVPYHAQRALPLQNILAVHHSLDLPDS